MTMELIIRVLFSLIKRIEICSWKVEIKVTKNAGSIQKINVIIVIIKSMEVLNF
jgi:hypothetical protein